MSYRRRHVELPAWSVPMVYALAAFLGGLTLPRLEARLLPGWTAPIDSGAALAIGSSIASGMIALTGIVFSLAFVMVQFSATAYSPRLVVWIARDRVVWHAIGVFTATFLYCLAAMAWVNRSPSVTMPLLTSLAVVFLLLASVAMFVALIERISLLQINRMLLFTGNQGRRAIAQMYADRAPGTEPEAVAVAPPAAVTQALTHAGQPRVIQALDLHLLLELAREADAVVEAVAAVGDTVVEGRPLLRVCGASRHVDERALRAAIHDGLERTFEQDPKFALRLLVDIAIKALSPAVNDPTTAVQALDQIEDLLLQLGRRSLDISTLRDRAGVVRVVIPSPSWDDFVALAFDEIRYCGATSVQVMRRMRALTSDLIAVLPADRHASLRHYQERLNSTIARSFADEEEKRQASVEDRQGLGVTRHHP
ncbi:MAG: DUF2254 domain-containing protein [Rhizobacter sp.]